MAQLSFIHANSLVLLVFIFGVARTLSSSDDGVCGVDDENCDTAEDQSTFDDLDRYEVGSSDLPFTCVWSKHDSPDIRQTYEQGCCTCKVSLIKPTQGKAIDNETYDLVQEDTACQVFQTETFEVNANCSYKCSCKLTNYYVSALHYDPSDSTKKVWSLFKELAYTCRCLNT